MAAKPKVLVVDDEDDVRSEIARILEKREEFEIATAGSGEEALQKIKDGQFDVVLLDIRMPRFSGIDALKEIKKLGKGVEPIMVTALDDAKTAWEVSQVGAFDFITKPFKNEDLVLRVKLAAERKKESDSYREIRDFLRLKSENPQEFQKVIDEWTEYSSRSGGSLLLGVDEIKFVLQKRATDPEWYKKD